MTEPTSKKLTRRDAIKILGAAAGAAALANLPSKWSAPELTQGILPAHAQTSTSPIFYSITCDVDTSFQVSPFNGTVGVIVSPNNPGIPMNLLVTGGYLPFEQTVNIAGLPSNPVLTGAGGIISIPITITVVPITADTGFLSFFWTFVDPSLDFYDCTQIISWDLGAP